MQGTILSVFQSLTTDVAIDAGFVKRIHDYQEAFCHKNEDHVQFFGGNLLGVHPIRFLPSDRNTWFDDIIQVDDLALQEDLYKLPTIDPNHKVASDVMNQSCIWAMYAIANSPHLTPAQKEQGLIDTALVLQYKYLTSIMWRQFKYPADPALAQATYNALTRKFALKVTGSWKALLIQRAKDIISNSSIHHRTIQTLSPDQAVIYAINDIQGRLREIVKAMVAVFYRVREEGGKVLTNKATTVEEGGIVLVKDVDRPGSSYLRYIHEVIDDKQTFVRDELVKIICDAMHTMPPKLFVETLEWMAVNHRASPGKKIDTFLDETVIYAYNFVAEQRALQGSHQGLTNMLIKLRALYMASRMVDPQLILTRDLSEDLVRMAVHTQNATVIASLRTGIQLYVVLRAFTKSYYS
jgi:hypothetical protein